MNFVIKMDTLDVLNRRWKRHTLANYPGMIDSPIFDALAAEYFASDA